MKMDPVEYERLRVFLYEHNGSQGPNPTSDGAGGLGGLYEVYNTLVEARIETLARKMDAIAADFVALYGDTSFDGTPAPIKAWREAAALTRASLTGPI